MTNLQEMLQVGGCCCSSNNALVVLALGLLLILKACRPGHTADPWLSHLYSGSLLLTLSVAFHLLPTSLAFPAAERREFPWVQSLASCFSHHFAIHIHSFNSLLCACNSQIDLFLTANVITGMPTSPLLITC